MRAFRLVSSAASLVLLVLAMPNGPAAAATDPALAAIPAQMAGAIVSNDVAHMRSACAANVHVVDEFAPFVWSGPGACVRWSAGFAALSKKIQLTGFKGAVAPNPVIDVSGNTAYVTAFVKFHGTLAGKPYSEDGAWTFVVDKGATGWKIDSLAWGTLHH